MKRKLARWTLIEARLMAKKNP